MKLAKATSRTARSGRALFLPLWFSYPPLYRLFTLLGLAALILCVRPVVASEAIELSSDTDIASAGYYQLRWDWPNATAQTQFVLSETSNIGGKISEREIYSGSDQASVISGKPDGSYTYTIRVLDQQQNAIASSDRVRVVVEHHPLSRAIVFFVIGLCIFMAIWLVILRGSARYKEN